MTTEKMAEHVAKLQGQRDSLASVLVQAIETSGYSVSGPTDVRAAENGEPVWVCNAREALARVAARQNAAENESGIVAQCGGNYWGTC